MASLSADLPSPIPELLKHLKAAQPPVLTPATQAHKDLFIARAPGRLDIMGGIADYTGSLVCELPIDLAAAVAVQRRDDHRIVIQTFNPVTEASGASPERVELSIDDFYGTASLLPTETLQKLFAGPRHWAAYFAGAFPVLAKHKKLTRRATGANIACYSTVPMSLGLASSAAITCASLWALAAAYHLILEPVEIAVLAQKIEQQIAGGPCGVMDQATAILGKKDQILLLKCQPHEVEGYIPTPPDLTFAGISSGVKHSLQTGGYKRARVAAFVAHEIVARMYRDLGVKKDPTDGYLANVTPAMYEKYFLAVLPEKISGRSFLEQYTAAGDRVVTVDPAETYHPRAAAEHHVLENARAHALAGILRELQGAKTIADRKPLAIRAGALMLESHRSYSEKARLGAKETDLLVNLVMQRGPDRGLYGAKITGGGEGGTVAVLAEAGNSTLSQLSEISADYEKQTGLKSDLVLASSAGSAESGTFKIPLGGI